MNERNSITRELPSTRMRGFRRRIMADFERLYCCENSARPQMLSPCKFSWAAITLVIGHESRVRYMATSNTAAPAMSGAINTVTRSANLNACRRLELDIDEGDVRRHAVPKY